MYPNLYADIKKYTMFINSCYFVSEHISELNAKFTFG